MEWHALCEWRDAGAGVRRREFDTGIHGIPGGPKMARSKTKKREGDPVVKPEKPRGTKKPAGKKIAGKASRRPRA
jgi:hypothetical protein